MAKTTILCKNGAMYEDILKEVGLTPNEAKIYRSLLELKSGSIWDIASHAEIHRRNAYDAIQRLIDKGLAYQVLPKKTLTYAPVHPDKLQEILSEKMKDLEDALPKMIGTFRKALAPQAMYVYKGIGGLKNYINLILEEKKDIYGIGSKGTWFDERISNFAKRMGKKYEALGIKSHVIYDEVLRSYPEVIRIVGKNYKFLPKKYSTESSIDIFGQYVAIYSGVTAKGLTDNVAIFIVKDKTLAADFMKWWQFMWDVLPVVK